MIPYGFGFEPNDYNAMLGLQIDFKALRRQCKALVKKDVAKATLFHFSKAASMAVALKTQCRGLVAGNNPA